MLDSDTFKPGSRHRERTHGDGHGVGEQDSRQKGTRLIDTFSRSITYLRISLTDQCNLRCLYCTPKETAKLRHHELLSYEELLRVVRLAVNMGIKKVRLTGGEPLVRRGVTDFIRRLAGIPGLGDIRLTTNGVRLEQYADRLWDSGITKLNISLDTMRPERYREITGFDLFARVWDGIERVKAMGFASIKINMVAMKGVNDDELMDFARMTLDEPLQVRFIEFMPIGSGTVWEKDHYISSREIQKRIARSGGELEPVSADRMEGPARIYKLKKARGSLGFISPISHHFCDRCNRLRLTAEGRLRSCLLSDEETDLKQALRAGATDSAIEELLLDTIAAKPKGHTLHEGKRGNCHGQMSRIGG